MSCKRSSADLQDPDYESIVSSDQKRLKVIEEDNKEATVVKIENIFKKEFNKEWQLKEAELDLIDQRLYHARKMLAQLRSCIVLYYYTANEKGEASLSRDTMHPMAGHPAVKKLLEGVSKLSIIPSRKHTLGESSKVSTVVNTKELVVACEQGELIDKSVKDLSSTSDFSSSLLRKIQTCQDSSRCSRFKIKKRIVVGNVSKYIPVEKREEKDQSTHKWMVYVRGPKEEPHIDHFVKKVWFFLHPSYRPNDLVEVNHPPFHLTRRGWGEFNIRVQLHFHDPRNKKVDVLHTLKLDDSYTGLQTLGAETIVDILIFKPGALSSKVEDASKVCDVDSFICDNGGIVMSSVHAAVDEECHNDAGQISKVKVKVEPYPEEPFCETVLQIKADSFDACDSNDSVSSNLLTDEQFVCFGHKMQSDESNRNECNDTLISSAGENHDLSATKFDDVHTIITPRSEVDSGSLITTSPTTVDAAIHPLVSTVESSSTLSFPAQMVTNSSTKPQPEDQAAGFSKQSPNGTTTFVKFADKHGNLYLIPFPTFLKLNSSVRSVDCQNASSSLKMVQPCITDCVTPQVEGTLKSALASAILTGSVPPKTNFSVSLLSGAKSSAVHSSTGVQSCVLSQVAKQQNPLIISSGSKLNRLVSVSDLPLKHACQQKNHLSAAIKTAPVTEEKNHRFHIQEMRLSLDSFNSMEEVLKCMLRYYPLVDPHPDLVNHPYCAKSFTTFLSWHIGKKSAAEWQRAKAVRSKLLQMCQKCDKWSSSNIWSTKKILMWCRHYGYTPMKSESASSASQSPETGVGSTYTSASEILERLESVMTSWRSEGKALDDEEEEIDVITMEVETHGTKRSASSPIKKEHAGSVHLRPTPCGEFIREAVEQVGVRLNLEEIVDGVCAPVVEALLTGTRLLAEDILRQSLALAFERNGGKKCPPEICLTDVTKAASKLPLCDFLTDRFMGTKFEQYHLLDSKSIMSQL